MSDTLGSEYRYLRQSVPRKDGLDKVQDGFAMRMIAIRRGACTQRFSPAPTRTRESSASIDPRRKLRPACVRCSPGQIPRYGWVFTLGTRLPWPEATYVTMANLSRL